jgi:DNA processing protein
MTEPRALRPEDLDYPHGLRSLPRPPERVFVRGDLAVLHRPAAAIVGARRASEEGRQIARELARAVASAGGLVVSGGALGVDTAAHRAAVELGAPTLVVLPSPLSAPHPSSNRRLFDEVLQAGGLWLSETEQIRGRGAFCARNRLIAALAQVVVVVEGRAGSGTLHTVAAACRLGRHLAPVPWALSDPRGEVGREALRRGGAALPDARALVRLLGLSPGRSSASSAVSTPQGVEGLILRRLRRTGASVEELVVALDVPIGDVLRGLTALELAGQVRAAPGGRFSCG